MQVSCVYAVAIGKPHFGNVSTVQPSCGFLQACAPIQIDCFVHTANVGPTVCFLGVALLHAAIVQVFT